MTPPAVAPPAPVSAPQTAAPPGSSGAPNGTASGGTSFGTILDSARTADAEGQREAGKKAGDQNSNDKSSDGDAPPRSKAGDAELLAAAVAFLTGQAPQDPASQAGGAAGADAPAASAASAGGPATAAGADAPAASGAPSTAASPTDASSPTVKGAPAAASSTAANACAGSPAAPASAQAAAGGGPASGSTGDSQGTPPTTLPVATGAYKSQHAAAGSAVASGTTGLQRAAEEANAKSQAQAQADAHAAQATAGAADGARKPGTDRHQDGAKQTVPGRQGMETAVANTGNPAAASSPSQTQAQGTTTAATSPTAAGQAPAGSGGHTGTGTGADGHTASAGQQGPTSAAGTAPAAGGGSTPTNVFSVPATGAGSAAALRQEGKLADGIVRTAVTMQEAADAVRATFTAANHAGVSSARITLSPAELGGIKISLSQTADGLIARVATDHPEAAQTLQQSAGELRRSLEAGGMQLLRLDIGSSGQQQLGGFGGSHGDGSSPTPSPGGAQSDAAEEDTASSPTQLTIELASGSLVNVLA